MALADPEGSSTDDHSAPWARPDVVAWSQLLLNSYRRWIGRDLIRRLGGPDEQARALFSASVVVVSHGTEDDPILNYGTQSALTLWEMTWEELQQTPSRLTAEAVNRAEREWMLEQARTRGYFANYRGVRITHRGRRFLIEGAVVWNVIDSDGHRLGQAATFSQWTFL